MLRYSPAVFAVEDTYQIGILVTRASFVWVRVDGVCYYDEHNGVMNASEEIHCVTLPMQVLDRAKEYTVCVQPIVQHKPYFTKTEAVCEYTYAFSPVPSRGIRAYHLADTHGRIEEPLAAARTFGSIDLLILNGDLVSFNETLDDCRRTFLFADALTHGNIPVVYARGNHDLRGALAYKRAAYTPLCDGKPYYTFRLGPLWGVILDCAEDKPDTHEEYGGTVHCHAFRTAQTAFLQDIIAKQAYQAEGVQTRLVLSHNPFTFVKHPPFDIETDTYAQWSRLLREYIKPHSMLCGHVHDVRVEAVGGEFDCLGQPCPVILGSKPGEDYFAGVGLVFDGDTVTVVVTDSNSNTLAKQNI